MEGGGDPLPMPSKIFQDQAVPSQAFAEVNAILEDIRSFNENLFVCCLLTYGCLLRPHKEIRLLQWGNFSEDMSLISLSGKRNKSGRNRIVPVHPHIASHLQRGEARTTSLRKDLNHSIRRIFKSIWTRYKRSSLYVGPEQTLYSFRHTGAIEIYKRTGSLTVLQQAMGHASLAVSLGYLRNLEVPMLKVEDMPMFEHVISLF